jgi:hypothetical protein
MLELLLYLVILGVCFGAPPLIARLIFSTFFPRVWSHRFVRWGMYCALLCLTYNVLEALTFTSDVHIPDYSFELERGSAGFNEFHDAERVLYRFVQLRHLLDRFFPFVISPAMLVAMVIYTVDRSQQVRRSKN